MLFTRCSMPQKNQLHNYDNDQGFISLLKSNAFQEIQTDIQNHYKIRCLLIRRIITIISTVYLEKQLRNSSFPPYISDRQTKMSNYRVASLLKILCVSVNFLIKMEIINVVLFIDLLRL